MTDLLALAERPCETPLIELLEGVPVDGRHMYEHSPTHHQNVPYGRLCHEAAAALREAHATIQKQALGGITAFDENRELSAEGDRLKGLLYVTRQERNEAQAEVERLRALRPMIAHLRVSALADDWETFDADLARIDAELREKK